MADIYLKEMFTGRRFVSFFSCPHPRIRVLRTSSPWKWAPRPAPANRGPALSEAGPGRKKTAGFAAKTVAFLLINGARAESRVACRTCSLTHRKMKRKEIVSGQRRRAWGPHKRVLLFSVLCLFLTRPRSARGPRISMELPGCRAWSYLIRGGFRPNSRAALRLEGTDPIKLSTWTKEGAGN